MRDRLIGELLRRLLFGVGAWRWQHLVSVTRRAGEKIVIAAFADQRRERQLFGAARAFLKRGERGGLAFSERVQYTPGEFVHLAMRLVSCDSDRDQGH